MFIKRIDELIELIVHFPALFPYSISKGTYKAVVTRQVSIIYRIKELDLIEIVTLWDNRQDSAKNSDW